MRVITLEEHFANPGFLDGPGKRLKQQASTAGSPIAGLLDQLCDVGDKRIAAMDAAGIAVQVLSLTAPGTEQLEAADAKLAGQRGERVPRGRRRATSDAVCRIRRAADRGP